ncbi:MAG TPA: chemotaxis protein CheA, partial [Planctomycetes bacterium]|nr:chemotaxis protein CheA [Planctomycetota bacterium]
QRRDEDLLNEMFRAAHSLKGLSALLGLSDINNLTHKIENVFDAARRDELTITSDVVELMFMGLDKLVALVDQLKDPDAQPVDCQTVLEGIRRLLQSAGVERKQASQADAEQAFSSGSQSPDAEAQPPGPEDPVPGDCPPQPDPLEDVRDEEDIPHKYLSIFIDEAELSLDEFTVALLSLEDGGSPDELNSLLVIAHKIKGSAASVGLNRAAKLAHLMEDVLQDLVADRGTLSSEVADVLLKCTDALRQYAQHLRQGPGCSDQFGPLARQLVEIHSSGAASSADAAVTTPDTSGRQPTPDATLKGPSAAPSGLSSQLRSRVGAAAPQGATTFAGEVRFEPNLMIAGLKAQLIYEKLSDLGKVCYCQPTLDELEQIDQLDCFRFGLSSEQSLEAICDHLQIAGVQAVLVEPLQPGAPGSHPTAEPTPAVVEPDAAPQGEAPAASAATTASAALAASAVKQPQEAAPQEKPSPTRTCSAEKGSRPAETVRVDIDRLDHLMNLAGQLVINKAQFSRIGEKLKGVLNCKQSVQTLDRVLDQLSKVSDEDELRLGDQRLHSELHQFRSLARRIQNDLESVRREVQTLGQARDFVRDLFEAIHQLDRVSDGIQQSVMDTRMVPIGPLFARFKRVIRDITRANGKSIRLEIKGEKTELDKRMIDELGDPLVHMVRNSADHGIELPEQREDAGKPRQGTVTLEAFHRGNSIVIRVSDDGRGLDADRILSKCLDKGLLSPADAEKMTPHQIHQMIWEPGLSTAEKVTEVSGRGMGMDIVKSKIEGLGGMVDVESHPGQGTTFTIKLPLTLAILPSLMVEIHNDVFAMPIEAVREIVHVSPEHLSTLQGRQVALIRSRVISMVELDQVLRFSRTRRDTPPNQSRETTLVIVGEIGQEVGLAVDRVIGEEDVVIKSIAENYQNVPGIAGASILGDGRVSLILDVSALIDILSQRNLAATPC